MWQAENMPEATLLVAVLHSQFLVGSRVATILLGRLYACLPLDSTITSGACSWLGLPHKLDRWISNGRYRHDCSGDAWNVGGLLLALVVLRLLTVFSFFCHLIPDMGCYGGLDGWVVVLPASQRPSLASSAI